MMANMREAVMQRSKERNAGHTMEEAGESHGDHAEAEVEVTDY